MKKGKKINIEENKNTSLIPAVIQDCKTKEVLMLAYVNKESLKKSLSTGTTWFWSRTKKRLWNKGQVSGNIQKIKEIKYDCDGDALLISVEQIGNACHTGMKSCFYRTLENIDNNLDFKKYFKENSKQNILDELYGVIESRIKNKVSDSYTYSLHKKGLDEIIKKFGEESMEVILSSKHQEKQDMTSEIADLVYHLLVLMVEKKITLNELFDELKNRRK
ncbi:MAG: bifunctional phosphoribosyl-AMP cyclohydrolase/phosphoribosyl-ATP pyrophosphatase [Candidatus Hydromicrobium americanum]|nr:MAG: bifunctional phosphoribosyl-AMP cyclohydrolase/phosphoribosyl-ATP pyrophosphatase [Candidatus Hydromicrobium americanum]